MGGGKGGGGGGDIPADTSTTVHYAPYLEAAHSALLNHTGSDAPTFSFLDVFNATMKKQYGFSDAINEDLLGSPYRDYEQQDIDEFFFGMTVNDPAVTYEIKNFPSLWDMFGKFMAGLDVHDLWGQVYDDVIQGPEIENVIIAHGETLQNEIDTKVLPRFLAGMRDINSVQATTFVIGKAIIQDAHVRELNKFGAQIRIHALDVSATLWTKHLEWNKAVITTYAEIGKIYYTARLDMDRANLEYKAKDDMWNITLFENARAIYGALGGGTATGASGGAANEPSQLQKSLGGAMMGAGAGAMIGAEVGWIGGPMGAAVGGLLGLASSFF